MGKLEVSEQFLQEEIRSDYLVSTEQKKLWAAELDILDKFQKVCDREGIRYYAIGGTHLGAVRHKGFIPWDDDIDIAMPRTDYEKLCRIAPDVFKEPYFFQTDRIDIGFDRMFARLRNSNMTMLPYCDLHAKLPYNQGVYIDIFPWDNVPDDEEEYRKWLKELETLKRKFHILSLASLHYRTEMEKETLITRLRYISGPILSFFSLRFGIHNFYLKRFEKLCRRYEHEKTARCSLLNYPGTKLHDKLTYKQTDFGEGKKAPFEMLEVTLPDNSEYLLEKLYGDWKEPVKAASHHRTLYYNTEKSYKELT